MSHCRNDDSESDVSIRELYSLGLPLRKLLLIQSCCSFDMSEFRKSVAGRIEAVPDTLGLVVVMGRAEDSHHLLQDQVIRPRFSQEMRFSLLKGRLQIDSI